jgi:hypothetical protein
METASYFVRKKTPVIFTLLDCTMAFDKCRFDILFEKLLERNLPPVVLRVLVYVYQEQYAWVKWGKEKLRLFRIQNGTRQGSVLSPSPSRSALLKMLKLCEKYALETNLHFSTHPDPD